MARLTVPVKVRWSDIDGYGHVNNAAVLTILEEARIAAFWADPDDEGTAAGGRIRAVGPAVDSPTFIAHQEIEYAAPLSYTPAPLQVEVWLARMGGASIDVCYEIPGDDGAAVRAMTTLVLIDPVTQRPRRITEEERAAWSDLVEAPVKFRRDLSR